MTHKPYRFQPKSNSWRRLLAPMLLLSLGVHGALLMIPVGSSDEAAIPPPDPEQDNIAIIRIPPPATQTKQAPEQALIPSTPLARSAQTTPVQQAAQPGLVSRQARTQASNQSQTQVRRTNQQPEQRSTRETSQATTPNPASSPTAAATPTPAPPSLPLSDVERPFFNPAISQRLLAHVQSLRQRQSQLNEMVPDLIKQYVYSAENTSGEVFGSNLAAWVADVKQATGNADLRNEALQPSLTLKHYRRVCLTPPPQKAFVGALVSPTGAIQDTPKLLQSTGYPFLNDVVLETVKTHTFPSTGTQKAYTIDVNVQIDYGSTDCLKP
ncbi:MAG TPA: hypothetical protein V6D07_10315 [Trichocoleus sp.]